MTSNNNEFVQNIYSNTSIYDKNQIPHSYDEIGPIDITVHRGIDFPNLFQLMCLMDKVIFNL